jgi:hypothetical protein
LIDDSSGQKGKGGGVNYIWMIPRLKATQKLRITRSHHYTVESQRKEAPRFTVGID